MPGVFFKELIYCYTKTYKLKKKPNKKKMNYAKQIYSQVDQKFNLGNVKKIPQKDEKNKAQTYMQIKVQTKLVQMLIKHLPNADKNVLNVHVIPIIREQVHIVVTKLNAQILSDSEVKYGVLL